MRVFVWGCAFKIGERSEFNTLEIPAEYLSVEIGQKSKGMEIIGAAPQLCVISQGERRTVSPLWINFDTVDEAEELVKKLDRAVKLCKKVDVSHDKLLASNEAQEEMSKLNKMGVITVVLDTQGGKVK